MALLVFTGPSANAQISGTNYLYKTIAVGFPIPNLVTDNGICTVGTHISPYAPKSFTYEWSTDGVNFGTVAGNIGPFFDKHNTNSYTANVYLRISNTCGAYTKHYSFTVPKPQGYCALRMVYPNTTNPVEASDLEVFPNPSSAFWYVVLSNKAIKTANLELRDLSGKLLYATYLDDTHQDAIAIPNAKLAKGIYNLRVITNLHVRGFKLIKN
ncbi:MAG: T9SS type A sorting domain-containing protein [Bacteroidetes bacterium]|nr:T9SS type A sorting domain-containing protein [Bacteroidota bacterium]